MAAPRKPIKGLRCPKCGGETIAHAGTTVDSRGSSGGQRYACSTHQNRKKINCWNGTRPIGIEEHERSGVPRKRAARLLRRVKGAKGVRRYVITSAQNATPVNKPFFAALRRYCEANDAQLIVIPYLYKNPTSRWSSRAAANAWWAQELHPYLLDYRVELNDNLLLLGDIKTQPTASRPLEGFETISGARSAIIGHPKLELIAVPTPQSKLPKVLTTTGAVTEKNYIPSKAGKKGEFHHTFGAAVVEIVGKLFYLRQLNALKDGSFCDWDYEYFPDRPREKAHVQAVVCGDEHREFKDDAVVSAVYGPGGIVEQLKPDWLVRHDIHDFYAGSHWHKGDPFIRYAKHKAGVDDVKAELQKTFDHLGRTTPQGTHSLVVFSNHHDHLTRWARDTDNARDWRNCVFWAQCYEYACRTSHMTPSGVSIPDLFAYWGRQMLRPDHAKQVTFLEPGESRLISGILVGYHGNEGANGARGSITTFAKIGAKTFVGHSHIPGIRDGAYQVGTFGRLDVTFIRGQPSSWLNTGGLIYRNGKRSLFNIINGKARP
ncbi:MAG: hypothetical protein ACRD0K_26890 [Egibacteraceae bacterium]